MGMGTLQAFSASTIQRERRDLERDDGGDERRDSGVDEAGLGGSVVTHRAADGPSDGHQQPAASTAVVQSHQSRHGVGCRAERVLERRALEHQPLCTRTHTDSPEGSTE